MTYQIPGTYTAPLANQVDAGSPVDEHLMGDTFAADVLAIESQVTLIQAQAGRNLGMAPWVPSLATQLGQSPYSGRGRTITISPSTPLGVRIMFCNGALFLLENNSGVVSLYKYNPITMALVTSAVIVSSSTSGMYPAMCSDGTNIWVAFGAVLGTQSTHKLYQVSPSTLAILNSVTFAHPLPQSSPNICFDGSNIWSAQGDGYVEQVNIALLISVSAYQVGTITNTSADILWDGVYLWGIFNIGGSFKLCQINPTNGSVLFSIVTTGGIAYDGRHIWTTTTGVGTLIGINVVTTVTEKSISISGSASQNCLFFDGYYLWVQNSTSGATITKIDVSTFVANAITLPFSYYSADKQFMAFDGQLVWFTLNGSTVLNAIPSN